MFGFIGVMAYLATILLMGAFGPQGRSEWGAVFLVVIYTLVPFGICLTFALTTLKPWVLKAVTQKQAIVRGVVLSFAVCLGTGVLLVAVGALFTGPEDWAQAFKAVGAFIGAAAAYGALPSLLGGALIGHFAWAADGAK